MKKAFSFLFLFLSLLPLWSHEGSMAGAGKLRVSQTKYFDIIYGEKNLQTAEILYENADAVFEELAAAYGIEPYFRMPVVITATVQQFNAYYSDSPFNRIVIYDTAQIEDLAVFSQTLLSTFTHELTHALTYNLKSKGMIIASKIFGDVISGHYITVTNGMAEGATVSYESSGGEGRLNDPYILQMLRQAKLEGQFPSYSDVKGASDSYPRNSFYYFNGAFAEYLQQNYGMQKYAEFWYRCINVKNITTAGAFKKTYGIKLNKAWKAFEEALEIPEVAGADPIATGQAIDFFDNTKGTYSIENNSGSIYKNLCVSSTGFAYFDDSCNAVYFVPKGQDEKPQRLFFQDYLDSINFSSDGRFLVVSYYNAVAATIKHCAKLYDFKYKKIISLKGTNYVCPTVIFTNGHYYFVSQQYESQKYSIVVEELNTDSQVSLWGNTVVHTFDIEQVPSDFTDLGNGQFAFILKSALDYSICISDVSFSQIKEYPVPKENLKLRDLSASSNKLLFSWATKDTFPRLGYLDLTNGDYFLMQENISGGVYSPVEVNGHIYYTAQFYKQNRLLELAEPNIQPFDKFVNHEGEVSVTSKETLVVPEPVEGPLLNTPLPYTNFSPFRYAFEGILLPVGGLNSQIPTLGFTYLTSLPWYASITMLSGGYDFQTKKGIFSLSYQSGTDTDLLQYAINSSFSVDKFGFNDFTGNATVTSGFDFARTSAVLFTLQADINYGKLNNEADNLFLNSMQLGAVSWTNAHYSGAGTYEKAGITLTAALVHSYETILGQTDNQSPHSFDVELDAAVYIPKLIPILCIDNYTYNLPVKIKTNLFSLSESDLRLAKINAETVLFGYDIQKAIPFLSAFYMNDVILTLQYIGGFDYASSEDYSRDWHFLYAADYLEQLKSGSLYYKDYAIIKISLGFTPNIGAFANPQLRNNLYCSWTFGKKQNLPQNIFNIGLEAKF